MRWLMWAAFLLALLVPTEVDAQERYGSFIYSENRDGFTDEDRSLIFTSSTETTSSIVGNEGGGLGIRCDGQDELDVLFLIGKFMVGDSDNDLLVRYRFDSKAPSEYFYAPLARSSNESFFIPEDRDDEVAREILRSQRALFEVIDPLDEETIRYTFQLDGATRTAQNLDCI